MSRNLHASVLGVHVVFTPMYMESDGLPSMTIYVVMGEVCLHKANVKKEGQCPRQAHVMLAE